MGIQNKLQRRGSAQNPQLMTEEAKALRGRWQHGLPEPLCCVRGTKSEAVKSPKRETNVCFESLCSDSTWTQAGQNNLAYMTYIVGAGREESITDCLWPVKRVSRLVSEPQKVDPPLQAPSAKRQSALFQILRAPHSGIGGRSIGQLAAEEGGSPPGLHSPDFLPWSRRETETNGSSVRHSTALLLHKQGCCV